MSMSGGIRNRLDTVWGSDQFGAGGLSINNSLPSKRTRSRKLEEKNVLACGTMDRAVENVIGTGIRLRSTSQDETFRNWINDKFKRKTRGKFMDVRRMFSWGQMQRLIYRSCKRDGDILVVLINRGYGPELQLVEGDSVETPPYLYDTRVIDGVEMNAFNAPIAYWVRVVDANGAVSHQRVPARDAIFLINSRRYNVVRGNPEFDGSYELFDMIVAYLEAVVVASRTGASHAIIAKLKDPKTALTALTQKKNAQTGEGEPQSHRPAYPINPGMVNFIRCEEELTAFNPSQPQQNFPDAMRTFARFVGLKWGLTVERVMLDFSKSNYSVSRSTVLQEIRTAEIDQDEFDSSFCSRFWPWFVGVTLKTEPYPYGDPPEDRYDYDWMPQGRPLVEQSREAPGQAIRLKIGVESIQNLCEEQGYTMEQIATDHDKARKFYAKLGIPYPVDMIDQTTLAAAAAAAAAPDPTPSTSS